MEHTRRNIIFFSPINARALNRSAIFCHTSSHSFAAAAVLLYLLKICSFSAYVVIKMYNSVAMVDHVICVNVESENLAKMQPFSANVYESNLCVKA